MPTIELKTIINAPIDVCFDLSRNIDTNVNSMEKSKEQAVAGVITGLIGLGETVTWKAKHFGLNMKMTVKITQLDFPVSFTDEMVKGPFAMMKHKHSFYHQDNQTLMADVFEYKSPLGILDRIADRLFLKKYMHRLLKDRNSFIKALAESSHYDKSNASQPLPSSP